jgi:hypothetical protein
MLPRSRQNIHQTTRWLKHQTDGDAFLAKSEPSFVLCFQCDQALLLLGPRFKLSHKYRMKNRVWLLLFLLRMMAPDKGRLLCPPFFSRFHGWFFLPRPKMLACACLGGNEGGV